MLIEEICDFAYLMSSLSPHSVATVYGSNRFNAVSFVTKASLKNCVVLGFLDVKCDLYIFCSWKEHCFIEDRGYISRSSILIDRKPLFEFFSSTFSSTEIASEGGKYQRRDTLLLSTPARGKTHKVRKSLEQK